MTRTEKADGLRFGRRTVLRTGGALALGGLAGVGWRRQSAVADVGAADNLIPNGDFEQLAGGFPTDWRQFNAAAPVTRVDDPTHSGTSAVRLLDPDASVSMGLRSNRVPITGGEAYQAAAWMLVREGAPSIYLEFWNAAGSRISTVQTGAGPDTEWQQLSVRGLAPESAVRASVLLYSSSTSVGDIIADDASLRLLTAAELLQVPNADFEQVSGDQPAAWKQWVPATPYDSSDEIARSGERSAHYANPSWETKGGFRSAQVPVHEGTRYQVEAHTLAGQGNPVLGLEYWDAGSNRLAAYFSSPGPRSDDWYPISTGATAPAGVVAATVMLYSVTAPTEIWWDDVVVTEVAPEQVRTHPLQVTEHPRFNLGPADVDRLRGLESSTTPTPIGLVGQELFADIVGRAEAFVAETAISITYYGGHQVSYPAPPPQPAPMPPPPGFTGKYPYWSGLGLAIRDRLDTLACAYTLTGRADFADKIKSYVTTLAGWEVWADPQFGVGADQFTGYVTQAVATAYDQIHDAFADAERPQVVATLAGKGLELIFADAVPSGGQIGATAPALVMGGLVLLGEDDRADRYLTRAEDMFGHWLDYRLESGQNEGFLYTAFTSNPMVRSLAAIERVTGDTTLSRHRFLSEFVWRWHLYAAAPPAGFSAYSDALARGFAGTTLHYLNRFLDNGYAGWLLSTCEFAPEHWMLMDRVYWFEPDAPVTVPDGLGSAHLPEVGEADLRSGFTPDRGLLTIRANDSVYGHNHYDQASIQLAIGGAWIGRDPGYRDLGTKGPTAVFSQRDGHSTILVDGHGQTQLGQGSISDVFLASGFDHVTASAAGAYVRPDLSRFDRRMMRIGPNRFALIDEVAAPADHRFTFQLLQGPLYQHHTDGIAFHGHNGAAELWGHTADGAPQTISHVQYPGAEQYGYLLHATGDSPVSSSTRFTTLEVAAVEDDVHLLAADLLERAASRDGVRVMQHAGVTLLRSADGIVELTISVPDDGDYLFESVFMTGNSYGHSSLEVDGVALGGAYDPSFFALVPGPVFGHGVVRLTAGDHQVRYVSAPGSQGERAMALQSLRVVREELAEVARDLGLTAEHRTGTGIAGLVTRCDRDLRTAVLGAEGDIGWLAEWIVRTDGSVRRLGELATDAEVAVVQSGHASVLHRLGAIRTTQVRVRGRLLASASAPVNLAVDASDSDAVAVVVETAAAATVEVRIGRDRREQTEQLTVRPGRDGQGLAFDLPAGRHELVFVH